MTNQTKGLPIKCIGLIESLVEVFPDALWQRCVVHFCQNVLRAVPKGKAREVALRLKAIHAREDRAAAQEKATAVSTKLDETNNPLERLNREIRRRMCVVGSFPDGQSLCGRGVSHFYLLVSN